MAMQGDKDGFFTVKTCEARTQRSLVVFPRLTRC